MNCQTTDRKILSEVTAVCAAINEAAQRVLPGMPGLGNYYETRLARGEMLTDPERFLLIYIATMFPQDTQVLEIAAGAAQLSAGLALLGFQHVSAIEIDRDRAALAKTLCEAACPGKVNVVRRAWQEWVCLLKHPGPGLLVTWNAVSSQCSKEREAKTFQTWWNTGGDIILCPALYGKQDDNFMLVSYGRTLPYDLFHLHHSHIGGRHHAVLPID